MKKDKNTLLIGLIYVILFALYNLIVFVVFDTRTNVFWISYAFMVVAFLMQGASMTLAFNKRDVETIFFGIPLASLSIFYLLAELFCSLVFMIFQGAGIKAAITVQFLLLGIYMIVAIVALMSRDVVQEIIDETRDKIVFHKSMVADVEILQSRCEDPELRSRIGKLAETIRYSDPKTNSSIEDVEFKIMQKMSELRVYCDNQQKVEALQACSNLELLFVERNKKLIISK